MRSTKRHLILAAVISTVLILAMLAQPARAQDPLAGITIEPESNSPAYARSQYRHWTDSDRDCQNQRAEVLIQESLQPVTFKTSRECRVTTGLWYDPYTAKTFTDAGKVDVDHFIPLKEAHESGGINWTPEKRELYANWMVNSLHLIAVDRSANRSKGARDPAEWLPPNQAYRCGYVKTWISIKREWGLSMDAQEAARVREVLAGC